MMNEMKELTYSELLDIRTVIRDGLVRERCKFNETYERYGKDTILYEISHRQVKELENAEKIFESVVDVLRENDLYTYGE